MCDIHLALMRIGRLTGCHQLPERSFHIKGYQFPLCARCTGIVIGELAAAPLWFVCSPSLITACVLLTPLVIDGMMQYCGILMSTNLRRVITGFLAGWGLITIYIQLFLLAREFFLKIILP